MEQTLEKAPRIEVVDALRGFAVMAIILVHNLEHFIFPVYPAGSPGWLDTLDRGVRSVVYAGRSRYAGRCRYPEDGWNSVRHVAETRLYIGFGFIFRVALQKSEVRCNDIRFALLREDEPYKLYSPIRYRGIHIFPRRAWPCTLLRVYRKPDYRHMHIPDTGTLLQVVARQASARPFGIYMA